MKLLCLKFDQLAFVVRSMTRFVISCAPRFSAALVRAARSSGDSCTMAFAAAACFAVNALGSCAFARDATLDVSVVPTFA